MSGRPLCCHLNAVKVDSTVIPGHIWRCWCPDCETPLPANWRRPCCGTEPETPHWWNCARQAPLSPRPAARIPADPGPIEISRPSRRRAGSTAAAVLSPVLAVGVIVAVLLATHAGPPSGPEAYNPADAQVCQIWHAQGVHVPEGNGASIIGNWEDPGYAKYDAAQAALASAQDGGNTSPDLAGDITAWEADMMSSYVIVHGDWGFMNILSDKAAVTSWCKQNGYT